LAVKNHVKKSKTIFGRGKSFFPGIIVPDFLHFGISFFPVCFGRICRFGPESGISGTGF
jgi:hypothetical protein